ncbi:DEAD/DEAH box helicase [Spirosoma pulveris]
MSTLGLYEQLINKVIHAKLLALDKDKFYIKEDVLDRAEAAQYLSAYLSDIIRSALSSFSADDAIDKQIELSNKLIRLLRDELADETFDDDLIWVEGRILSAILSKTNASFTDFDRHLREITPLTRLTHSELFTGNNSGISFDSELRKEILSADEICFLVSFIKWTGIRIFEKELRAFTDSGRRLRVITTSYMGATDLKAVEFLASLKHTEVRVSYNTESERLHAKAYLFLRNTGFHTGYIGSSNISRSALTSGLEWNLKITTQEVKHIIDKSQKTFETYWQDKSFEPFNLATDTLKLQTALRRQRASTQADISVYFDIKPHAFQQEILDRLQAERSLHERFRNLIVAATGTGKTVVSAFDYKYYRQNNQRARLLFVAHRKEILEQAMATFRGVLRDANFGELWVEGIIPDSYEHVFASVQTLNNAIDKLPLTADYYDYVVIDEVHHIAATSYRPVLQKFSPIILLGLTATPERMDNENILTDFCNTIAAEIRLPEALNKGLLCPFQYFGLTDAVDLSDVQWRNGRYVPGELSKLYTRNDLRVGQIINQLQKYVNDLQNVRALGFCITQEHAQYMAEKFLLAGLKADYLVSSRSEGRAELRSRLRNKDINYLFVVDIFNEGVDIPEVDTLLFLRPTESLTVFLQQIGRGLRLSEGKECLTVLDFVGNARPEYSFEDKFRALVGRTTTSIQKEVENDFPHLPLGCSIVLEKKAKDYVLQNIRAATQLNRNQLIIKIRNYRHQTTLPLTLRNFSELNHIQLPLIYRRDKDSWHRLCADAGIQESFSEVNELEIVRAIRKKWLAGGSVSYFNFIERLAKQGFKVDVKRLSTIEQQFCLMLHYDIWQQAGGFADLSESIQAVGRNPVLVNEIREVISLLTDHTNVVEKLIDLPYDQPLRVYGRYTRDQILAAFNIHTFTRRSSSREGVVYSPELQTELLFVTLHKSAKDYSPTTLYNDYAVSEDQFHWQTQNRVSPNTPTGQSYIKHREQEKHILLFVREANENQYGANFGYVFLGKVNYLSHEGARPMNINWGLEEALPAYLWHDTVKMAVG